MLPRAGETLLSSHGHDFVWESGDHDQSNSLRLKRKGTVSAQYRLLDFTKSIR